MIKSRYQLEKLFAVNHEERIQNPTHIYYLIPSDRRRLLFFYMKIRATPKFFHVAPYLASPELIHVPLRCVDVRLNVLVTHYNDSIKRGFRRQRQMTKSLLLFLYRIRFFNAGVRSVASPPWITTAVVRVIKKVFGRTERFLPDVRNVGSLNSKDRNHVPGCFF